MTRVTTNAQQRIGNISICSFRLMTGLEQNLACLIVILSSLPESPNCRACDSSSLQLPKPVSDAPAVFLVGFASSFLALLNNIAENAGKYPFHLTLFVAIDESRPHHQTRTSSFITRRRHQLHTPRRPPPPSTLPRASTPPSTSFHQSCSSRVQAIDADFTLAQTSPCCPTHRSRQLAAVRAAARRRERKDNPGDSTGLLLRLIGSSSTSGSWCPTGACCPCRR